MAYCLPWRNGKAFSRGMLPWELYEDAQQLRAGFSWRLSRASRGNLHRVTL